MRRFPGKWNFLILVTMLLSLLAALTSTGAQGRESAFSVGVISDPDGYTNAREGPSKEFPVIRRVPDGEHFLVSHWPYSDLVAELDQPEVRERLRKRGMDPDDLVNWRWVILLDRKPGQTYGAAGRWAYMHASRIKIVRSDARTWGITIDPDGYTNVRAEPQGRILGRVTDQECFIILEPPGDPGGRTASQPWTRIMTRAGVVGFLKTDRLQYHDGREWNWAGSIPFVDY